MIVARRASRYTDALNEGARGRQPMKRIIICVLMFAAVAADAAHVQFIEPWHRTPKIVIVGPNGDSRLAAVDEAVAFWNRTLQQIGSGFRLGPVTRTVGPVPEEALQMLSTSVLSAGGRTAN